MLFMSSTTSSIEHSLARALCSALAFESLYKHDDQAVLPSNAGAVHSHTIVKGTLTSSSKVNIEEDEDEFFDAIEFHSEDCGGLHLAISTSSSVEMIRGGASSPVLSSSSRDSLQVRSRSYTPPPSTIDEEESLPTFTAPAPPKETPLRFLRAGKGDPVLGRQRYEQTLAWRKENGMDTIMKEPHPHFELIKRHYPHFFHLKGKQNEYVYYESPPKMNLKALREGGINLKGLLRHYAIVTEFMWQYVDRNDLGKSIYVIDLKGIRFTDFAGECVDFVRKASEFTGAHYPERSGYIFVINVPSWFKVIWSVVKPMVDEVTLKKIYILRGQKEIFNALCERIPIENIPPEYGGKSMPLGQAPEERLLWDLMTHNNHLAAGGQCRGVHGSSPCPFCTFVPARSY